MTATPIELLLSKLPDAKRNRNGWSARCPAHEDRRPSLSISQGDDERALVRCHAGCTVDAICGAVGLRVADLMAADGVDVDKTQRLTRKTPVASARDGGKTYPTAKAAVAALERQQGKRSALWTYHDPHGNPVGMIVRWDKTDGEKDIRPVARRGDQWIIGGMPKPRPLYCLADLVGAARVYVCEGEKAVEAAQSIGLTATTSPHGADSAGMTDWSPLAGKECMVLPDNDSPGRKYADAVTAILTKLEPAPIVRVIELPGLPNHGDIVDWIDAHGDAAEPAELRQKVEAFADEAEAIQPDRPADRTQRFQPFAVHVLPEPIRDFVIAGADSIGCGASFVALPLLCGLAGAVGATRWVQPRPDWTEPCVLWAAIVGESGTQKSPAQTMAIRALEEMQGWHLDQLPEMQRQYERDEALYDADMKEWHKKGRTKGEPPPCKPEEPSAKRYIVGNTTIESLADLL
ncbi:MAG: DUF3987 domain-containing protein, partial [Pirellulales bacterium]